MAPVPPVVVMVGAKISTQTTLTAKQKSVLDVLPEVIARKSRYSYGIVVNKMITELSDLDQKLDKVTTDPEGDRVAARMDWFLRQVRTKRKGNLSLITRPTPRRDADRKGRSRLLYRKLTHVFLG